MSRHLFLFVSVAFLVAATCIYGGVRPGQIERVVHSEFHADVQSLRDDARIIHQQAGILRADLLVLWLEARADAFLLRADAHFEALQLAKPFVTEEEY
jgi:hypothetical protein